MNFSFLLTRIESILPILDSDTGDKAAKEIIESISEKISKAIDGDEEVAGVVVNKDMRAFREKQLKLEREKREKEEQEEKYGFI